MLTTYGTMQTYLNIPNYRVNDNNRCLCHALSNYGVKLKKLWQNTVTFEHLNSLSI